MNMHFINIEIDRRVADQDGEGALLDYMKKLGHIRESMSMVVRMLILAKRLNGEKN